MQTTATPVLDLSTERERLSVRIDGVPYALRGRHDLTIREYRVITRVGSQLDELETKDEMTEAEAASYAALLGQMCDVALEAPSDVMAKLDDIQRRAVVRSFLEHLHPSLVKAGRRLTPPSPAPPSGTRSSRGSSGSTAPATRGRGSRRSR